MELEEGWGEDETGDLRGVITVNAFMRGKLGLGGDWPRPRKLY